MGIHTGKRPTRNESAFIPANLLSAEKITGEIKQDVVRGDVLYKTPGGFEETLESVCVSTLSGIGYEIAMEMHNGELYMAAAHVGGNGFSVFKLNGTVWEKTPRGNFNLPNTAFGISLISYDDKLYLAIAHTTANFLAIYVLMGNTWILAGDNLTDLPTGNGRGARFRVFDNKLYLAIAHEVSPFVTTYVKDIGSDNWTKLPNPTTLPTGNGQGVTLNTFNNELYLSVVHVGSPFVTNYKLNTANNTWSIMTQPSVLPVGNANGTKFKEIDGIWYLSVAHTTAPFVTHWQLNTANNTWVALPAFDATNRPPTSAFKAHLFQRNGVIYSTANHNNEPFITTCKLVNGAWVKLADPFPIAEHNWINSTVTSWYMEIYEDSDDIYMALTYQYQPHIKVYKWDQANERWSDEGLVNMFGGHAAAVSEVDGVVFGGDLFMSFVFNGGSQFATYRKPPNQPPKLLKRPVTAPGASAGGRLIVFNSKLYMLVCHSTTPFFRMYEFNTSTEQWDLVTGPVDLPAGNASSIDAIVNGSTMYVAVGHATTPFLTTYTFSTSGVWTRIANPSPLPINIPNDMSFANIGGVVHLIGIATGTDGIFSYRFVSNAWQATSREIANVGTSSPGMTTAEYNGNTYAFAGVNTGPAGYMYRWNPGTSTWLNDPGFLPRIKGAINRTMMYADGADLYAAYSMTADSSGQGRVEVFKRTTNGWISVYTTNILGEQGYRMRFFRFDGALHFMVGTQFAPFFRIFRLSETPFKEVWSKQPLDYYGYVGFAGESGVAGSEIDIFVVRK